MGVVFVQVEGSHVFLLKYFGLQHFPKKIKEKKRYRGFSKAPFKQEQKMPLRNCKCSGVHNGHRRYKCKIIPSSSLNTVPVG